MLMENQSKEYAYDGLMNLPIKEQIFYSVHQWWKKNAKVFFIVVLGVLTVLLLVASYRMTIVAVASQPDCVPHSQSIDDGISAHRAAKSAC